MQVEGSLHKALCQEALLYRLSVLLGFLSYLRLRLVLAVLHFAFFLLPHRVFLCCILLLLGLFFGS